MLNTMPELIQFTIILTVTFAAATVLLAYLYIQESQKRQKLERLSPNTALKDAQQKGQNLIHQALKKAQAIIGKAELEGIEVVAESKLSTKKFEEKYGKELEEEITKAAQAFAKYLDDLRTQGEQTQLLNQEYSKQKINEIFEKFEQNLADFLTQTEQKSVSAIDLELKATRQLIDTYKTQQLSLIDENIIAMLEKTLSLVLVNKISLKDEVDLVYEALEKAKAEKFIS